MQLHYKRAGTGPALFILHGLFGSLENLGASTKLLAEHWNTIAVDLRNHGRSPHSEDHSYPLMAQDILELADALEIKQFHLLGHSMGGKVAMELAVTAPERVLSLVVVDIAPVSYPHHHRDVLSALRSVPLSEIKSRAQAEGHMKEWIETDSIRAFLLKNLARNAKGQFIWKANVDALEANYDSIRGGITSGRYDGPVLFIKGALSEYIKSEYQPEVLARFPKVQLKIIDQAGHWPHAEKPSIFNRIIESFLSAHRSG